MWGNVNQNDTKTVYQADVTKLNSTVNQIRDCDVKCKAKYNNDSINLTPCNLTSPTLYEAYMFTVKHQLKKYTKHEVK